MVICLWFQPPPTEAGVLEGEELVRLHAAMLWFEKVCHIEYGKNDQRKLLPQHRPQAPSRTQEHRRASCKLLRASTTQKIREVNENWKHKLANNNHQNSPKVFLLPLMRSQAWSTTEYLEYFNLFFCTEDCGCVFPTFGQNHILQNSVDPCCPQIFWPKRYCGTHTFLPRRERPRHL